MRLLVLSSLTEGSTAHYLVAAFRRSGHQVLLCSDAAGPGADVRATGLVDLTALLRRIRFSAEAVIFIEGGSMRLLPDTTSTRDIRCAWYAIDTHMDFAKHVRIGRLFDATFVAQKQYVEALSERGVARTSWLPLAFEPELVPEDPVPREIDVAYVGSANGAVHSERMELLNALCGQGWRTSFGRAAPAEMGRLYVASKIVFNRSVNNDVNMRFFEAMGAGAVLVTDRIRGNGVDELFTEGVHYVAYSGKEELVRRVRELLANPPRLREVGEAARRLVAASHTYQHRADAMVASLSGLTKAPCPEAPDVFGACLALGLTADAVGVAGRAMASIGGGRYPRALGGAAGNCLRLMAAGLRGAEGLRKLTRGWGDG